MKRSFIRRTGAWTIAQFWQDFQLKKINFSPDYQRESIWTQEKQSYFIDSVVKGLPSPPIFVHERIDTDTGKTTYEIIDGKQRLESILKFIKNEIQIMDVSSVLSPSLIDDAIEGKYFKDFTNDLEDYKISFWSYEILVEYINRPEDGIVEQIFDRLNRNGEPLKGQELRNAQFHNSDLMKFIYSIKDDLGIPDLGRLDKKRMEDIEFISEVCFICIESKIMDGSSEKIDQLWDKYKDLDSGMETYLQNKLLKYAKTIKRLDFAITGVTHLYAIWLFIWHCDKENIPEEKCEAVLNNFFIEFKTKGSTQPFEKYRKSTTSRTKTEGQRKLRLEAIKDYMENL